MSTFGNFNSSSNENPTCSDCLFMGGAYRWSSDTYCNKLGREVDYDKPACSYFLDNSHDCCYDCEYGKDMSIAGFYCTALKKKIPVPGSWVCPNFRD